MKVSPLSVISNLLKYSAAEAFALLLGPRWWTANKLLKQYTAWFKKNLLPSVCNFLHVHCLIKLALKAPAVSDPILPFRTTTETCLYNMCSTELKLYLTAVSCLENYCASTKSAVIEHPRLPQPPCFSNCFLGSLRKVQVSWSASQVATWFQFISTVRLLAASKTVFYITQASYLPRTTANAFNCHAITIHT